MLSGRHIFPGKKRTFFYGWLYNQNISLSTDEHKAARATAERGSSDHGRPAAKSDGAAAELREPLPEPNQGAQREGLDRCQVSVSNGERDGDPSSLKI